MGVYSENSGILLGLSISARYMILQYFVVFIEFQEATENKGVDVILEMLSNVNLEKDLGLLSQNGIVGVCPRSQNGKTIRCMPHMSFQANYYRFGSMRRRM